MHVIMKEIQWPRIGKNSQSSSRWCNAHLVSPNIVSIMTPQDFIQSRLKKLNQTTGIPAQNNPEDQIVKLTLSKRFRKYSANDTLINHVKKVVHYCVERNQPINFTFLHGAYKLWRLEEAPCADWAELFALMYYTNYVKNICAIYEPGVWFDFFVDDWIIEDIDKISPDEIKSYLDSYRALIDFLKPYQPNNLKMTITPVSSQFASRQEFEQKLSDNEQNLELPELDEVASRMVELNAKVDDSVKADPKWREKIYRKHNAYMIIKGETGYHKERPDKILIFSQPLPSGTTISLGTTKSSIAKFWVGVGALKVDRDSYKEVILSPKQLKDAIFDWQGVHIEGLDGTNFQKIRIVS